MIRNKSKIKVNDLLNLFKEWFLRKGMVKPASEITTQIAIYGLFENRKKVIYFKI